MPDGAVPVLLTLARRSQALEAETAELEREMRRRSTEDEGVQRLLKVPGVGPDHGDRAGRHHPRCQRFPFGP